MLEYTKFSQNGAIWYVGLMWSFDTLPIICEESPKNGGSDWSDLWSHAINCDSFRPAYFIITHAICIYAVEIEIAGTKVPVKACSQHMDWNELNWREQVDPVTRRVHWSGASASRLYFVLIGCSETRTVSARFVVNTCIIPIRLLTLELSLVQFTCCGQSLRKHCGMYVCRRKTLR